ncbi:YebF family protein [Brenneria goodwinii]|uniref:YebF family protein n=1 Tax=Brenneria goodwinii TaxID=1109412 RepID=UPI000908232B|nr:YebF family protein [Brenneria goodwinii]
MGWKKKTTFGAFVVLIAGICYKNYIRYAGPTCDEVPYDKIVMEVRSDLVKYRIPRWPELRQDKLGTSTPVISFHTNDSFKSPDTYTLAVTVSGPEKNHRMFAMYECKTGLIEYSGSVSKQWGQS